jgi:hypothetical protein
MGLAAGTIVAIVIGVVLGAIVAIVGTIASRPSRGGAPVKDDVDVH